MTTFQVNHCYMDVSDEGLQRQYMDVMRILDLGHYKIVWRTDHPNGGHSEPTITRLIDFWPLNHFYIETPCGP